MFNIKLIFFVFFLTLFNLLCWSQDMSLINSNIGANLISLFISYEFMPMFNVTDNEEDFKIRQNPLTLGIRLWL